LGEILLGYLIDPTVMEAVFVEPHSL